MSLEQHTSLTPEQRALTVSLEGRCWCEGAELCSLHCAIAAAIHQAEQAEREACAREADKLAYADAPLDTAEAGYNQACKQIAAAIRARKDGVV